MNNVYELNTTSFDRILAISEHSVKTELQPVLKKSEIFELEDAKKNVINGLKKILILTNKEKQYLIEFSKGNYIPSLLFDEIEASKIERHPMAKWRIAHLKK